MSVRVTQAPVAPAAAHAALLTGLGTCTVVVAAWAWSPPVVAFGALLAGFVGARPLSRLVFERGMRPPGPVGRLEMGAGEVHFIVGGQLRLAVSRHDARGLFAAPIVGGVFPGRQLSVFCADNEVIEWFLEGEPEEVEHLVEQVSATLHQPLG